MATYEYKKQLFNSHVFAFRECLISQQYPFCFLVYEFSYYVARGCLIALSNFVDAAETA
jgi:hypothetical protein